MTTLSIRKTATAALAAVVLSAAALTAGITDAEAGKKKHHHLKNFGIGLGIGVGTGLLLGGVYGPGYYPGPYVYGPECFVKKVKKYNKWGHPVIVHKQVCY